MEKGVHANEHAENPQKSQRGPGSATYRLDEFE